MNITRVQNQPNFRARYFGMPTTEGRIARSIGTHGSNYDWRKGKEGVANMKTALTHQGDRDIMHIPTHDVHGGLVLQTSKLTGDLSKPNPKVITPMPDPSKVAEVAAGNLRKLAEMPAHTPKSTAVPRSESKHSAQDVLREASLRERKYYPPFLQR